MKLNSTLLFLLGVFYCPLWIGSLSAQEQLGVRLDNYSGMQSAFLNPTHTANLPLRWNFNMGGLGIFLDNTYAYLANTNTLDIIRNVENIKFRTQYKNKPQPADAIWIDFFDGKRRRFGNVEARINGPAITFRNQRHSGGIFYNFRFQTQAPRIPKQFNYYEFEKLPYRQIIDVDPGEFTTMLWDEFGANYAYTWETEVGRAQIGTNVKYLRGFEGVYGGSWSKIKFARYPKDTAYLGVPDISFGTTTGNFDNIADGRYQLMHQGQGIGIDLGFSWLIAEYEDTYKWRLSAALLDAGKINFGPKAENHYFNKINPTNFITSDDFKSVKSPTQFIRKTSILTVGDTVKSYRGQKFAISTPMAICLMADYQFYPHAFASVILQQRILQEDAPLHRGNLLAGSVRYEHRWFSASLPLSVYNYKHFRAGFAMRLAYLTVGTENMASWFVKRKFTGTDWYFNLTFNPFDLNINALNIHTSKAGKRKNIKCFKF
jgi:hypothetical protein